LQELALEREKSEIKMKNSEVEKLINDDFNHQAKAELFLNQNKVSFLQEESKRIFVKFLESNSIGFLELKDGIVKLSSKSVKEFTRLLKNKLILTDRESQFLFRINKIGDLKISFTTQNNDEFKILYLYLNHKLMRMIISLMDREKKLYTMLKHNYYKNGYAVIFRLNFKQLKVKSILQVIVVDNNMQFINEVDYFEFIRDCSKSDSEFDRDLKGLEEKVLIEVIKSKEKHEIRESTIQNRLIDIKINSIKNYFQKKINKAKRLKKKVNDEGIIRMKIGQVENLEVKEKDKINELMNQKRMVSDFEILGIVGIE